MEINSLIIPTTKKAEARIQGLKLDDMKKYVFQRIK